MSTHTVFKIVFFALFILLLAIRGFFGWRARRAGHSSWRVDQGAVQREGRLSLTLRPVAFLGMLAFAVLYALSPDATGRAFVTLPPWLRWLGVALAAGGLPALYWVHHTLREYWSTVLQLREQHALVTEGPYRWVRHPMYAALMLCFVGLALVSALWPFMALVAVSILFFRRVAGIEEAMMIERFGDAYRNYLAHTGRFLPWLSRRT